MDEAKMLRVVGWHHRCRLTRLRPTIRSTAASASSYEQAHRRSSHKEAGGMNMTDQADARDEIIQGRAPH